MPFAFGQSAIPGGSALSIGAIQSKFWWVSWHRRSPRSCRKDQFAFLGFHSADISVMRRRSRFRRAVAKLQVSARSIASSLIPPRGRRRCETAIGCWRAACESSCDRRFGDLSKSVRLRLYRAMITSAGDRLPSLLLSVAPSGRLPPIFRHDRLFAEELGMRLLIRQGEPWIGLLDTEPIALKAPGILFQNAGKRGG